MVNDLLSTTCELRWETARSQYESANCTVPDTSLAGSWELEVSLDGGSFFSSSVHAKCAAGIYEVDHGSFIGVRRCGPASCVLRLAPRALRAQR